MISSAVSRVLNYSYHSVSMLHELGQWQGTDLSMLMDDMDDSRLFMQWAVSTLEQQDPGGADGGSEKSAYFPSPQALRDSAELAEAQNSLSSGDDTGGGGGIISPAPDAAVHEGSWSMSSPTSGGLFAPSSMSSTGTSNALSMSWNFGAVLPPQPVSSGGGGTLAAGVPLGSCVSQRTRRASTKSTPYAQDHIMAERKRREKINQRFIELSAVIPGLKKMDKGTILTDATRYVKELQEKVRSLEAAGGNHRSVETVVLVRKPCRPVAPDVGESSARFLLAAGTPAIGNQLPEVEAKLSEDNVMVRIHCEMNGKGLVARVLAEVEELHLRIVHNDVMPFTASTVIITTMAKASYHQ
ncbi:transcription factor NAI1-like [Triticum urartu]|uniref:transcription factor NAI1-like n=1 Tax=Triticum urartu TaxID=4572 RepID=UPI00204333C1|nr:transcription factor NAI1-like [Triticum urartu]XP_048572547.1 transcription factor NAI1-like [Triticum urartu]